LRGFSVRNEKERGEVTPCLKPQAGVKRPNGLPFISVEEVKVMQIQTQFVQVVWNPNLAIMARRNIPFYPIKGFLDVYFENHEASSPFFGFKGVEEFTGKNRVVLNISGRNKSRLEGGDDVMEQGL
jgi:hypothetical protein